MCLPTPWDVIQIVRTTGLNPYKFIEFIPPDEISEVPKSDPTWLRRNGRRHMMALRRDKKGCYFRDPNRSGCTAYTSRPILCRLYPLKLHETRDGEFHSFTLHTNVGCPRHRDDEAPCGPAYELYLEDRKHQEDYADLVEFFNRNRSKDKRPEDFVKLFIPNVPPPTATS